MYSTRVDRRHFVTSGLGLAGAALLGTSLSGCSPDDILTPSSSTALRPRPIGSLDGDLFEPEIIRSVGGRLAVGITCATRPVTLAGRRVHKAVTYNGTFPGPTLVVRPGDMIDIRFTNKIVFAEADHEDNYGRPPRKTNEANLHYHGMHLSPVGTADNMLVTVQPNESYRYLFEIPHDHPAGLYWYHEHIHGLVTSHVSRGAAGMIYVSNAYTDQVAGLGIRTRLMALQQAYFADDESTLISDDGERLDPELALSLINGQLMPEIQMRPGEPQVWSLLNASSSAFYVLRLEDHTFDVIAEDGVPLRSPGRTNQETLMLPSGKRLEVVVTATTNRGRYELSFDEYNQGVDTWPQKPIGTMVVGGKAWDGSSHPGVDSSAGLIDLSSLTIPTALQRTIVFGQDNSVPEGMFGRFTMNGHAWDPNISEWTSKLGTTEEWRILNETEQDHPFHVHVNPFQVTKINGSPIGFGGYQDTAIVPRFGSLTVRTRLRDFAGGPILMHCHILDHEDMGMMTRFEIEP